MHCGDQRHLGLCLGYAPALAYGSCRVSDQGTTLRASDLHNARATILNPFSKTSMWKPVDLDLWRHNAQNGGSLQQQCVWKQSHPMKRLDTLVAKGKCHHNVTGVSGAALLSFCWHSRRANVMSWHYWTILVGRGPGGFFGTSTRVSRIQRLKSTKLNTDSWVVPWQLEEKNISYHSPAIKNDISHSDAWKRHPKLGKSSDDCRPKVDCTS